MGTLIEEKRLYEIVKKAVNEALQENLKKLKIDFIPYVDEKEMEEIRKIFGSPEKYKNQKFVKKEL